MSHKKMSKRQQKVQEIIAPVKEKKLEIQEAVNSLKNLPEVKFEQAVEISVHLGVDTAQAEQNLRGTIMLPNGSGKKVKVAVIADDEQAVAAREAGADIVGDDDLIKDIQSGNLDFDKLLSTQIRMKDVGKLGRVLGPKGLMPNPKDGTVTNDMKTAVDNIKKGRQVGFRTEKHGGVINLAVGRLSFSTEELETNIKEVITTLQKLKPSTVKGLYFKSVHVSSTMGASLELDVNKIIA